MILIAYAAASDKLSKGEYRLCVRTPPLALSFPHQLSERAPL